MPEVHFEDGSSLPAHTLFCIGRNYAAHARELDNPVPDRPVIFIKPDTAIVQDGGEIVLPAVSDDVHHEVELVVVLGSGGRYLDEAAAHACIAGYGVGIDVTARDIQNEAKSHAYPWTVGKGFDSFAPISRFISADRVADPQALQIALHVNGRQVQHGQTRDMLFPLARLIGTLSEVFTLQAGDLVFTGTPAGVARFVAGDVLEASLMEAGGIELARLRVSARDEWSRLREGGAQ